MKNRIFIVAIVCVGVFSFADLPARTVSPNVGTTSFGFLKIGIGARPASLGGAFVAMDRDVNAMNWNPASVATAPTRQGTVTYANYLVDSQFGIIGMVQPTGDAAGFGIGLSYMSYGELRKTNEKGEDEGTFGASDIVLHIAYARRVSRGWIAGVGAKILYSNMDTYSSDAYALDLGLRYQTPIRGFSVAASLLNVGFVRSGFSDRSEKDELPVMGKIGFVHYVAHLPLMLVGELTFPNDNDRYFSGGAEVNLKDTLFLRTSYTSVLRDLNEDEWAGVSVGAGFMWSGYRVDYAHSFFAELGGAHRVSLSGTF